MSLYVFSHRLPMKKYSCLKNGMSGFLVVMFVMAYVTLGFPPTYELFPFYSWSMFSEVPNDKVSFLVYVEGVNGEDFKEPILFQKAGKYVRGTGDINVQKFIQNFGKAVFEKDSEAVGKLRPLFEKKYLKGRVKYSVVREVMDPLKRWHGEKPDQEEIVVWEVQ